MVPNTRRRGLLSYGARYLGAFELRLPLEWPIRPVWDRIRTQNCTLLQTPEDPLNALHFKEVDGACKTPVARDLHPAHPLSAFGRPSPAGEGWQTEGMSRQLAVGLPVLLRVARNPQIPATKGFQGSP